MPNNQVPIQNNFWKCRSLGCEREHQRSPPWDSSASPRVPRSGTVLAQPPAVHRWLSGSCRRVTARTRRVPVSVPRVAGGVCGQPRASWRSLSLCLCPPLPQPANAKSKSRTKSGTTPRRNLAWFSRTSSAERFSPSSRRTSAPPKKCRSPSPSSWAWSSPPSATSSWTPGGAAWRSGRTTWAPGAPPQPPAPVPKRDGEQPARRSTAQHGGESGFAAGPFTGDLKHNPPGNKPQPSCNRGHFLRLLVSLSRRKLKINLFLYNTMLRTGEAGLKRRGVVREASFSWAPKSPGRQGCRCEPGQPAHAQRLPAGRRCWPHRPAPKLAAVAQPRENGAQSLTRRH